MKEKFEQQLNELIILMHQEQENINPQATFKLTNYIENLDKYKEYQIVKQLIDNK